MTRGFGTSISAFRPRNPAPAVYASGTQHSSSSCHDRTHLRRAVATLRRRGPRHGRRRLGSGRSILSAWRGQHADPDHNWAGHRFFCAEHGADYDDARRTPTKLAACSGDAAGRTRRTSRFAVAWTGCAAGRTRYNTTTGRTGCTATTLRPADALSPLEKQAFFSS